MLTTILQIKWAAGGIFVNDAFQVLDDLRDFLAAAHEGGHKAEIDAGSFPNGNGKGFAGGVHGFHAALLLDGALMEHICLALQLALIVQHFQRTQKIVGRIVGKRETVRTVIDKVVLCGKRIIEAV